MIERPGRSVVAFFTLTFLVTWTCFIAVARLGGFPAGQGPRHGLHLLVLLGTFAPSLVALALTARAAGGAGVRALLGRLVAWQVAGRWYAFAAGYWVAIKLAVALTHRIVAGAWPRFSDESWLLMAAATVFSTVIGGQAGEEIGWRGYALPRLAARLGLGGASLVLGAIWATWHLPLFFVPGADTYGQSFPMYLLQVIAISVAIAWLYWRTQGSLLLTMLMHAAINNANLVPAGTLIPGNPFGMSRSLVAWLTLVMLWIPAAYLLVRMRGAKLG
ncbi:MAG TPA: CPBP family intramembrane glutamic endopeptidase [Candidatus Eisenbacteria bacterium]